MIKAMADIGNILNVIRNILNNGEFFGDIVDTPKGGIEQHKKRECLKSAINKSKV